MLKRYHETMIDQLKLGIIEEVKKCQSIIHYLPYKPVFNEAKDKLRIVFDASSKTSKFAHFLNNCLFSGELLIANLVGILIRSILHLILVICDVKKAFLQIGIEKKDRDVTRFLWYKNPFKDKELGNTITYRFTRLTFGLIFSHYLLALTIQSHFKNSKNLLTEELKENIYVNNIIISARNAENAKEKNKKVKDLFRKTQMNIKKFMSKHTVHTFLNFWFLCR